MGEGMGWACLPRQAAQARANELTRHEHGPAAGRIRLEGAREGAGAPSPPMWVPGPPPIWIYLSPLLYSPFPKFRPHRWEDAWAYGGGS